MEIIYAVLLGIAAGVFIIVCAATDQDWFMNDHKAKFLVDHLGRAGARKFYIGLGIFIICVMICVMFFLPVP